jgi:hypothetical protein
MSKGLGTKNNTRWAGEQVGKSRSAAILVQAETPTNIATFSQNLAFRRRAQNGLV